MPRLAIGHFPGGAVSLFLSPFKKTLQPLCVIGRQQKIQVAATCATFSGFCSAHLSRDLWGKGSMGEPFVCAENTKGLKKKRFAGNRILLTGKDLEISISSICQYNPAKGKIVPEWCPSEQANL